MGALVDFFRWFGDVLTKVLKMIVSFPGMVASAVTGCVTFVGSIFSRFTWLDGATNYVTSATTTIQSFMSRDFGVLGNVLIGWFALGRLAQFAGILVTSTIGITVLALVTLLLAVVALVPAILIVRSTMKSISVLSGGILKP